MVKSKLLIAASVLGVIFGGCMNNPHTMTAEESSSPAEQPAGTQVNQSQSSSTSQAARTVTAIFSGESLPEDKLEEIQTMCTELGALYQDLYANAEKKPRSEWDTGKVIDQQAIDQIEDVVKKAGYPVLNSSEAYPAFLEHPEKFKAFWMSVQNGVDAETSFWEVSDSGGLNYYEFQYVDGKPYSVSAFSQWGDDGQLKIDSAGRRNVQHWDMTYNGDFYYQDVPTDRHWEASILLRLKPVDQTLFELNQKYIKPIGYYNVNAFLCDWDRADYGSLSFNDLFEYLYKIENNDFVYTDSFEKDQYPYFHYCIPAELFEDTVLSYFDIPLEKFRERALYDAEKDIYPWQDINISNVAYFPTVIPEVIEYTENTDGSLTLTVRVMCPDMQTDNLFIHEVTVMPGVGGAFQYLGNRITQQGEQEMPSSQPRIPAQRTDI